jgi:hypothetical protein
MRSAAYFEEEAVEEGRDLRSDSKIIARAFGRNGSDHVKVADLTNASKSTASR